MKFQMKKLVPLFPNYVMQLQWDMPEGWNDRLYDLALQDHEEHLIRDIADPRNTAPLSVGNVDVANYYNQRRHNFFTNTRAPEVAELARMTEFAVRQYMRQVWHYEGNAGIRMICDALYQNKDHEDNAGIHGHNHWRHDIVCTYYPKITFDPNNPPPSKKHAGQVRFYDPSGMGKRLWPNQNPAHHYGSWWDVVPQTGTMLVFEGRLFHDSTYFGGIERMCIPVMCQVDTPNKHDYESPDDIARFQAGA